MSNRVIHFAMLLQWLQAVIRQIKTSKFVDSGLWIICRQMNLWSEILFLEKFVEITYIRK